MDFLGSYHERRVFWWDYTAFQLDHLPTGNWVCLASADRAINDEQYDAFVRYALSQGILEFKGHGAQGEFLHDVFDEIAVYQEVMYDLPFEAMTTWHNGQSLADVFWQCFFVTCLPDTTDWEQLAIVCTHLDGRDWRPQLKMLLHRFQKGWMPH